ncbi:MAG TPA: hypothetical protein PLW65_13475, partial [Pseudomonadota bacterium]|nr:hypothetical protein [Pseudomonadota bacterium]
MALGLGLGPASTLAAEVSISAAVAAPRAEQVSTPVDEGPHNVRRHYMWSNERRHDLFFDDLRGLGGGYLGVGGDQNYTMAAAAGSQVLWLVDLDGAVVHMHRLYAALLSVAATPAEFLALLEPVRKQAVVDAVAAYYPGLAEDERRAILSIYDIYRQDLSQHLHATAAYRWGGRAVTWLGDPALYDHLRQLAVARLIVPRLGDLTGPRTVLAIGEAARAAGVPVRTLYLSNAESWFHYGREFRRNLGALPFDDRSVVLRTVKSEVLAYPHGDIWHYSVQRADHFAEHLRDHDYKAVDVTMLDAVPCYPPPDPAASSASSTSSASSSSSSSSSSSNKPIRGLSHIGFPSP